MAVIALVVLWIGIFFCGVGVIGLLRFPDVYTRLHASGKVATLGLSFMLLGAALFRPEMTFKVIVLIFFVVLTSPVSTHAIASAAHRNYGRLKSGRDDLADCRDRMDDTDQQRERTEMLLTE